MGTAKDLRQELIIPPTPPRISTHTAKTSLGSKYSSLLERYRTISDEEMAERRAKERAENEERDRQRELGFRHREKLGFTSLPEKDWTITLESLKISAQNEIAIARVRKWNPHEMKKGIVLHGTVGTGKSTLCRALINQWASKTYRCKFISVTDALKAIRDGISNPDTTVARECNKLIEPELLILDDLGVDNASAWAEEQIFSILEARYHSGKHTIITTNMTSEQIAESYKQRIHDRLIEYCSWVKMAGDSFRKLGYKNEI